MVSTILTLADLERDGWQLAVGQVVCCDALDLMRLIPDKAVDLVLTDPPYGVGRDKGFEGFEGFGGFGKPIARIRYVGEWDDKRPEPQAFEHILRVSESALICGGNYFSDLLPAGNHWIVWDKLNTMPTFGDCELIWSNVKRDSVKKFTLQWNGLLGKEPCRFHATQKPVALMAYLIKTYSNPDSLILDPFMGSWTTAVACKELGRRWIGCELSRDYCEIGVKRLAQEVLDFQAVQR